MAREVPGFKSLFSITAEYWDLSLQGHLLFQDEEEKANPHVLAPSQRKAEGQIPGGTGGNQARWEDYCPGRLKQDDAADKAGLGYRASSKLSL